ncbi:MAG TPA: hypothetical protein VIO56_04900 [Methylotenera sp.]
MEEDKFKAVFYDRLEWIDKVLHGEGVPVYGRPLKASFLFLNACVKEVSIGTKEDFVKHEAFSILVGHAQNWYEQKYGSLANKKNKQKLSGLAKFLNEYVLLEIPTTLSKVEVPNETAWLIFPNEMHHQEFFTSFYDGELPLNKLSTDELADFQTLIKHSVNCSRKISLNLNLASMLSDEGYAMRNTIWTHVETAITNILTQELDKCSAAGWELFLAIEKMLKIYLSQFDVFKNTHDIEALVRAAKNVGLDINYDNIKKSLLEYTYHDFIKMRYAELKIDHNQAYCLYKNTLDVLLLISENIKREFEMNNAAFLIKKAPWAR